MTSRLHLVVSGLVQGVCFRDFARRQAQALGLVGWVRNLPNGRVAAVVEGDKAAIEKLLRQLRTGPPSSRVDRLEATWTEPEGGLSGFEIRY